MDEPDDLIRIVAALADDNGYLASPFPSRPIKVPRCWLEQDKLCWNLLALDECPTLNQQQLDRLLADFLAVADGRAGNVLSFAKKYGPLGLCAPHAMPLFHRPECHLPAMMENRDVMRISHVLIQADDSLRALWESNRDQCLRTVMSKWPKLVLASVNFSEALGGWFALARFIRAVLSLAAELKAGRHGSPGDWRAVINRELSPGENRFHVVAAAANRLLQIGGPAPIVTANPDGLLSLNFVNRSALESDNPYALIGSQFESSLSGALYSMIAITVALAVTGGRSFARCIGCGALYQPTRAPAAGRLQFCKTCGSRASWRLSKQRKRATNDSRRKKDGGKARTK